MGLTHQAKCWGWRGTRV